jgi:hypothetical protein
MHMTKQTIKIGFPAVKAAPKLGKVPARAAMPAITHEVEAEVIGDLALHRAVTYAGTVFSPRYWVVTHIPTGATMRGALPYGAAKNGNALKAGYLAWMDEFQALPAYAAWTREMAPATFGTVKPPAVSGKAVDLSRMIAAQGRDLVRPFLTV